MRPLLATALVVLTAVGCTTPGAHRPQAHTSAPAGQRPSASRAMTVTDTRVRRRLVLGFTNEHHPVVAIELGDADSPRRVLVVGCIHGSEPAGIAIARALQRASIPQEVDLWLVPDLNPDGVAADTRSNGRGVDLNRNFPYLWRPLGPPGSLHYAGSGAGSEAETRMTVALLRRVRPTLGIWYHQALDIVDSSQGPSRLERRYATDVGMGLRALPDYSGSAVGYEDHLFGPTAFVVELPAGDVTGPALTRHVRALLAVSVLAGPPIA